MTGAQTWVAHGRDYGDEILKCKFEKFSHNLAHFSDLRSSIKEYNKMVVVSNTHIRKSISYMDERQDLTFRD